MEAVICKNEYVPVYVVQVRRLDYTGLGPSTSWCIVVHPKQGRIFRDNEMGVRQMDSKYCMGAVTNEECGKILKV